MTEKKRSITLNYDVNMLKFSSLDKIYVWLITFVTNFDVFSLLLFTIINYFCLQLETNKRLHLQT